MADAISAAPIHIRFIVEIFPFGKEPLRELPATMRARRRASTAAAHPNAEAAHANGRAGLSSRSVADRVAQACRPPFPVPRDTARRRARAFAGSWPTPPAKTPAP